MKGDNAGADGPGEEATVWRKGTCHNFLPKLGALSDSPDFVSDGGRNFPVEISDF